MSIRVVVLVLVAGVISSCSGLGEHPETLQAETVRVLKVTDGDTIHVLRNRRDESVRLIGVDTPEVAWYGGKGECFGPQAGLYTRRRLGGRIVHLAFDAELHDRYGRLLAYVYLDAELFNLTLVRLGYATALPVAPNTRFRSRFAVAEAAARRMGLGLWSTCRR